MFEKWLNGQKGFQYYSKKGSNKVYLRETQDVTYNTCVASFSGDYRQISLQEALDEFGYIDNSKTITINQAILHREENSSQDSTR